MALRAFFGSRNEKETKQKLISQCINNQVQNILRLFDVLPNFPFPTSETMGDYY